MGSSDELFAAIEADDVDTVVSLLATDASLAEMRDDQGVSVLMRARNGSDRELMDAVMAAGPTLDIFEAAAFGKIEAMKELLDADPSLVTAFSADGFTALHFPAFFGGAEAARLLLGRDADVDAHGRGWMTRTPLDSAAAGRHIDVARLLLEAGADLNARQSGGWTPLHSAAHNGDLELVKLLLEHGADPNVTNDEGASALSMAEASGNADVIVQVRAALDT